jgi:hypothetical protein
MINGRKGKSHTGNRLLKDDDWPHLLQLLDAKGALAREQEVRNMRRMINLQRRINSGCATSRRPGAGMTFFFLFFLFFLPALLQVYFLLAAP